MPKFRVHPNQQIRKLAKAAGYFVRAGSFTGTTEDRLGRWYVGRNGQDFRPWGAGYRTQQEAWEAAAELAREIAS